MFPGSGPCRGDQNHTSRPSPDTVLRRWKGWRLISSQLRVDLPSHKLPPTSNPLPEANLIVHANGSSNLNQDRQTKPTCITGRLDLIHCCCIPDFFSTLALY